MKRTMCAHFPAWPLQRLVRERPELRHQPLALVNPRTPRGARLLCCSRAARQAGIRAGMTVAEARAILPAIHCEDDDPSRDRAELERLAIWAERYSPHVGLEEGETPSCLLLDVTGCAAYFHGEENLIGRATRDLQEEGWHPRIAIADTLGAAWAIAHFGQTPCVATATSDQLLLPLPLAALRLSAEAVALLHQLGIEQIGQLMALPTEDVPGRFGTQVVTRLNQTLGRTPELIVPHRPPPEVQAHQAFEYGVDRLELLYRVLDVLAESVQMQLQKRERGARQIECCLFYERLEPLRLAIGLLRPSNAAAHLALLVRTQLERAELAAPVCAMSLRVSVVEAIEERPGELFETERDYEAELSTLLDRLSNRLGREAVTRPVLVPDAQPEFAFRFEPVVAARIKPGRKKAASEPLSFGLAIEPRVVGWAAPSRPLHLEHRPTPIQVQATPRGQPAALMLLGEECRIVRTWGPERIATGWWRGHDVERDYYIVATEHGSRYWIFRRQPDGRWFLHGCYR